MRDPLREVQKRALSDVQMVNKRASQRDAKMQRSTGVCRFIISNANFSPRSFARRNARHAERRMTIEQITVVTSSKSPRHHRKCSSVRLPPNYPVRAAMKLFIPRHAVFRL